MEITITEALRIKNEVSNAVKTLEYSVRTASFGYTTEEDAIISEDTDKFNDVEVALINALRISEELNNSISNFNKDKGVDAIVRKMQNTKLLLNIYTQSLQRTKPTKTKRFEIVGNVRQNIEVVYTPYVSSTEMKNKISICKSGIRDYQSQVEKLNQLRIGVSFSYTDIENLIG